MSAGFVKDSSGRGVGGFIFLLAVIAATVGFVAYFGPNVMNTYKADKLLHDPNRKNICLSQTADVLTDRDTKRPYVGFGTDKYFVDNIVIKPGEPNSALLIVQMNNGLTKWERIPISLRDKYALTYGMSTTGCSRLPY